MGGGRAREIVGAQVRGARLGWSFLGLGCIPRGILVGSRLSLGFVLVVWVNGGFARWFMRQWSSFLVKRFRWHPIFW